MAKHNSYPPVKPDQQFGRLVVQSVAPPDKYGRKRRHCQCDCGTNPTISDSHLKRGTKSCGCLRGEVAREYFTKHGAAAAQTFEYNVWAHLKQRTLNQISKKFHDYGGRGITTCERWKISFEAFLADMGPVPNRQYSIERRDNNGHYSCGKCKECLTKGWPENCYWATPQEQSNNKRNNRFITYQGKTLTLAQWARKIGILANRLQARLDRYGWPLDRALKP